MTPLKGPPDDVMTNEPRYTKTLQTLQTDLRKEPYNKKASNTALINGRSYECS